MILVIKHIDIEGPGSMEGFFRHTAWGLRQVDLGRDDTLPDELDDVGAIISLGGPMNVYEEDKYPFLQDEDRLLKRAIKEEIPVLGICLGAQLLAKAAGAKVRRAPAQEIGWYKVNLTAGAGEDPLFQNLPSELEVFQWHQDMFSVPKGGFLLAESPACPHQAFKFGKNAYGLQFHIEVTAEMVESWIGAYLTEEKARLEAKDMLIQAHKKEEQLKKQAEMIYFNFSRIIAASQKIGVG